MLRFGISTKALILYWIIRWMFNERIVLSTSLPIAIALVKFLPNLSTQFSLVESTELLRGSWVILRPLFALICFCNNNMALRNLMFICLYCSALVLLSKERIIFNMVFYSSGVLPKYFSSEWSFAQFHLPEITRYIIAFGSQNTVMIVGMDGR